jgi:hypothetical protein
MTPSYNPYAPPDVRSSNGPHVPPEGVGRYVPLRQRTMLAAIAVSTEVLCSLGLDVSQLTSPKSWAEQTTTWALFTLAASVAYFASIVLSAVLFGMWIYRAAKNLRALGRRGMKFSPGACVGGFFIPFVNLVRPYRAMSELWRASTSDAECDGASWLMMGTSTGVLELWWATWILGNIVSNVSVRIDERMEAGTVGLLGSLVMGVSALAVIRLMLGVSTRQQEAAKRLAMGV